MGVRTPIPVMSGLEAIQNPGFDIVSKEMGREALYDDLLVLFMTLEIR